MFGGEGFDSNGSTGKLFSLLNDLLGDICLISKTQPKYKSRAA